MRMAQSFISTYSVTEFTRQVPFQAWQLPAQFLFAPASRSCPVKLHVALLDGCRMIASIARSGSFRSMAGAPQRNYLGQRQGTVAGLWHCLGQTCAEIDKSATIFAPCCVKFVRECKSWILQLCLDHMCRLQPSRQGGEHTTGRRGWEADGGDGHHCDRQPHIPIRTRPAADTLPPRPRRLHRGAIHEKMQECMHAWHACACRRRNTHDNKLHASLYLLRAHMSHSARATL